jgi:RNA polymerase sigma-70 factor (ECF subfamily)
VPVAQGDDEDALAEEWARGADGIVRRVWERYGTLVHTYCLRALGDRDAAADCTQETFVSAWRSRDRFDRSRGSLPGWLLGIARHRVHDTYRVRARTPETHSGEPADHSEPSTAREADELVERLLVADALTRLTPRARQIVELAYYGGLSQSEIAERLELPLGTVKSDTRRALHRLRDALEGGDPDG